MNKVLFLDRDGIINKKAKPHEHITKVEDFIILPKVKEALDIAKNLGYKIIIITNQRTLTESQISTIHDYMRAQLPQIDDIFVCNHGTNQNCNCRKPKPGLFYLAEKKYDIDKSQSLMIGDSQSDVEAGENYGIKSYLTKDLYHTIKEIL